MDWIIWIIVIIVVLAVVAVALLIAALLGVTVLLTAAIALVILVAAIIFLIVLTLMLVCFFKIFYSPKRKPLGKNEYPVLRGRAYDPYRAQITDWINEVRAMEHTDVCIKSHDGLKLRGKYYEYKKGAPIEILFHGYRGTAERDLCGGVHRCFELGHNVLIVDHRASGASDGHVITFGAKESRDCAAWINYVIENIDKDAKIIIAGVSMGAATVMTAAGTELPQNVVGAIADCGYTSTKDMVKKVMRDMRLPATIIYPFAWLSAIVFGRFSPSRLSPIKSMKKCRLPIIFFHGDADGFVPRKMSEKNYAACTSEYKRLVIVPGAAHCLCFPHDQEAYLNELRDFFEPLL